MKTFPLLFLTAAIGLAASFSASAQSVVFSAPTAFNSASRVIDHGSGSILYAVSFDQTGNLPSVTLPSGTVIPFSPDDSTHVTAASQGPLSKYGAYGVGTGNSTGNSNLDADLVAADYTGQYPVTLTLGGLTVGQAYAVQIFAADDRGINVGNTFTAASSISTLSSTNAAVYSYTQGAGQVGAQITGTFVATGANETLAVAVYQNGMAAGAQFNALIVETVPEPSTLAWTGGAAAGLIGFAFHRKRCSASPVQG